VTVSSLFSDSICERGWRRGWWKSRDSVNKLRNPAREKSCLKKRGLKRSWLLHPRALQWPYSEKAEVISIEEREKYMQRSSIVLRETEKWERPSSDRGREACLSEKRREADVDIEKYRREERKCLLKQREEASQKLSEESYYTSQRNRKMSHYISWSWEALMSSGSKARSLKRQKRENQYLKSEEIAPRIWRLWRRKTQLPLWKRNYLARRKRSGRSVKLCQRN